MTEQELKLWNEFNDAYNTEFKNLPFDSADEEFLFKRGCWWAWQASRAVVFVELPSAFDASMDDASYYEYAYLQDEVEKALEKAGVSYK